MNYTQTLDFLFNQLQMYQQIGAAAYKPDLKNAIAICNLLNNPQNQFPSIHIAGTNGKGSVSHLMASVLQEAGYKTGLFTSPHLKDFRERIKINNKKIKKSHVVDFVKKHYNDFLNIEPSFFEMTVGLAFEYFSNEKIDIAVIETGLGGRLDSTNVIMPELSVITNIAFDHTNLLGNKLSDIAYEKAGIIKKGIPVIVGETQNDIKSVFDYKAKSEKSKLIFADQLYSLEKYETPLLNSMNVRMTIKSSMGEIFKIYCPLMGFYQKKNVITAICALIELRNKGYIIEKQHIENGIRKVIKNTDFRGRWQILSKKPLTICDTGHNEAGITEIVKQLSKIKFNKLHFVLGMVNDKDIRAVLNLLPKKAKYYFCSPHIQRGLDAAVLCENAKQFNLLGIVYNSVSDALKDARNNAALNDMIFIGGSTFVVAEVV